MSLNENYNQLFSYYLDNKDFFSFGSHNGPYYDEETPVRQIVHRISFLCAYSLEHDTLKYDDVIKRLAEELNKKEYRPYGYNYYCRNSKGKDVVNGLVGAAWIIEGLVYLFLYSKSEKYLNAAEDLFLLHPIDEKLGLWKCVNIDGKELSFDMTFNHQLWFCAAGTFIYSIRDNERIKESIDIFLNRLDKRYAIYRSGLIREKIVPGTFKGKVLFQLKTIRECIRNIFMMPSMRYKEIGYHSFNLYAFAMIFQYMRMDPINIPIKLKKALTYINTSEYERGLMSRKHDCDINAHNLKKCELNINRYGFAYNVSGLEVPYIYNVFENTGLIDYTRVIFLYKKQIETVFNDEKWLSNTEDPSLVEDRIYELFRAENSVGGNNEIVGNCSI